MSTAGQHPSVFVATLLGLILLAVAPARAEDVAVGDPAEKVYSVLGTPRGAVRSGTLELLQFDRGRVEIREGVVTEVDLVSEEEARARQEDRARQAAELQAKREAYREQQLLAGIEARDRANANPEFLASSGSRQLEFWDSFRRRFPGVPVESEYTAALAKRDREAEAAATEKRLAEMERRVADAEDRAEQAEKDAEDAKRDSRRRQVYYLPPYVNVPYPYGYRTVSNPPGYTPSPIWGNSSYGLTQGHTRPTLTTTPTCAPSSPGMTVQFAY